MSSATVNTPATRAVAEKWFNALTQGDVATALGCLDDNVEWINYTVVPGYNDAMPWIGTYRGLSQVKQTFQVFGSVVQVKKEELLKLLVEGDEAAGLIHEVSTVKATNVDFEIEFVQWLTIRAGKIVRWKSYTDPSTIIRALQGRR
jgi:ketosteroid isomerase-like protein